MSEDLRTDSKEKTETAKTLTVDHAALLAQGFNVRTSGDEDGIEHGRAHAFEMMIWLNAFTTYNYHSESAILFPFFQILEQRDSSEGYSKLSPP